MVNGEDKQRGTWEIGKFGSESCLLEKMVQLEVQK